jgi:transcriptional regulator
MSQPSPFLAALRRALLDDFEVELELSCKVAVLQAAGYRRSEIARILDATPAALRSAIGRVEKAAARLDAGRD